MRFRAITLVPLWLNHSFAHFLRTVLELYRGQRSPLDSSTPAANIDAAISEAPIGSYHYIKLFDDGSAVPSQAMVYPMRVAAEHESWDECDERQRKWFRLRKAAAVAYEPDLKAFLGDLAAERVVLF